MVRPGGGWYGCGQGGKFTDGVAATMKMREGLQARGGEECVPFRGINPNSTGKFSYYPQPTSSVCWELNSIHDSRQHSSLAQANRGDELVVATAPHAPQHKPPHPDLHKNQWERVAYRMSTLTDQVSGHQSARSLHAMAKPTIRQIIDYLAGRRNTQRPAPIY